MKMQEVSALSAGQLEKTHPVDELRKDIARLKTEMTARRAAAGE